jgi:ribulose-5-phosphate 4-epimerase/fuculose-1-phosphate aldolase
MALAKNTIHPEISDAEWQLRCELAACYRIFIRFGWTDVIFTHLSARVPGHDDQYLINPYGLLFHEVTASNLIKVNFEGELISGDHPYNDAGHAIHSSVLKARPDINVALHSHTRAGMAVACMDEGLLPLSQQAAEVIDLVCYHEYGFADEDNPEECERLGADMSDKWLMIMHNHGLLSVGRTVAEAFFYLYTLESACKVQIDVMSSRATPKAISALALQQLSDYSKPKPEGPNDSSTRCWKALVRQLDTNDLTYKN